MKKFFYLILAFTTLVLGIVGILLPILPTTPFLLASLYLFSKGSERWKNWFVSGTIYKKYLKDFSEKRAMTLKQKIRIVIFADLMLLFPLVFTKIIHLKIFIVFLMIFKFYYFVYRIKTLDVSKEK